MPTQDFKGTINGNTITAGTGTVTIAAGKTLSYDEGTWTPVFTPSAGAITAWGTITGIWSKIGRIVTITFSATITTNGTAAGYFLLSGMTHNPPTGATGMGQEIGVSGKPLKLRQYSATQFIVSTYDGLYPGGDGAILAGTIIYEV